MTYQSVALLRGPHLPLAALPVAAEGHAVPLVQGLDYGPHFKEIVRRDSQEMREVESARRERERRREPGAESRRRRELRGDAPVPPQEVEPGGVEHRGDHGPVVDGDARRRRRNGRAGVPVSFFFFCPKSPLPEHREARLHEVADEDVGLREPRRPEQPLVGQELVALGGEPGREEVEVLPGEDVAAGLFHQLGEALGSSFFFFFFFLKSFFGIFGRI